MNDECGFIAKAWWWSGVRIRKKDRLFDDRKEVLEIMVTENKRPGSNSLKSQERREPSNAETRVNEE